MISNRTRYLAWQLPILLLLPAVFNPEMAWLSPNIGLWPLWLAAMPVTAWLLAMLSKPDESCVKAPLRPSQVLVFPTTKTSSSKSLQASRRAA